MVLVPVPGTEIDTMFPMDFSDMRSFATSDTDNHGTCTSYQVPATIGAMCVLETGGLC